ncbi:MAG: hypothetical protein AB1711_08020 [Thermodesulfobacteriota bacterium]
MRLKQRVEKIENAIEAGIRQKKRRKIIVCNDETKLAEMEAANPDAIIVILHIPEPKPLPKCM